MRKTDILGVKFDEVTPESAAERVVGFLGGASDRARTRTVVTPNPEMVMAAAGDAGFKDILNRADLCVPDGIGVVAASKILGGNLTTRVAGIELVEGIFERVSALGCECSVYLLGGKPGVAERAGRELSEKYGCIRIAGVCDGYFGAERERLIAEGIAGAAPDVLLVGLGFPKQERFMDSYKEVLGARVVVGCGGSLDVFAGEVARAPLAFRRLGLEWFYRLLKQPSRFRRMLVLPLFVLRVFKDRFRRRNI